VPNCEASAQPDAELAHSHQAQKTSSAAVAELSRPHPQDPDVLDQPDLARVDSRWPDGMTPINSTNLNTCSTENKFDQIFDKTTSSEQTFQQVTVRRRYGKTGYIRRLPSSH
jgi:hypothetical protein